MAKTAPRTLDYDAEEVTLLRALYKLMEKHYGLQEDDPGYASPSQIVEQFTVLKAFYKRERKKH